MASSNLFGSKWKWQWLVSDLPSIAQQVTVSGSFSVEVCKRGGGTTPGGLRVSQNEVEWTEQYIEVWTRWSTDENHQVRPAKPAQYLAEQAGWTFNGKGLTSVDISSGGQTSPVLEWHFAMTGTFTAVNGFYNTWVGASPTYGFYNSFPDNFAITRLVVDGQTIPQPPSSTLFNKMLYPGKGAPYVPGFPPPQTAGPSLQCVENWVLDWTRGHLPKSSYTVPSYNQV